MLVLDTLSVGGYALNGNGSFLLREELGCGWEVGKEDERDDAPSYAAGAEDYEDVHPPRDAWTHVSEAVLRVSGTEFYITALDVADGVA